MFQFESEAEIAPISKAEEERLNQERLAYSLVEKFLMRRVDLGAGQAARVFTMPEAGICVKEIINNDREFSLNNVFEEKDLMSGASEAGVRVAKPVMAFTCQEGSFIVMETIKGASIRDIWEGKVPLPESYDHDRFWDGVSKMIDRLHTASIYHRDLHAGNIMIDEATGDPVIIDFGLSCYTFDEEDPCLVKDFPLPGQTKVFRRDEDQVTQMRLQMLRYLQKKKNSV